jgi:hypothetical protein
VSPPKSKVRPHPFRRDLSVPPDQHGRVTCMCGLVDIPGDPRHTLPEVVGQDVRQRAAGDRDADA